MKNRRKPREETTSREVWPGMSEADWLIAERYLHRAIQVVRLPGWRIELQREPVQRSDSKRELMAEIVIPPGQEFGRLFLETDWARQTERDKRETFAHELTHCFLAPLEDGIQDLLEETLP